MSETTPGQNPDRVRAHLQAYFDGQLHDAALIGEIEERLASDSEFEAEMAELRALREQFRELPKSQAPSYLRSRIESAAREASVRDSRRSILQLLSLQSWRPLQWAGVAVVAVVFAVAGGSFLTRPRVQSDLDIFVLGHIAQLQSDPRGFEAEDTDTLEDWFKERLDFAPAMPRWDWVQPVSGQISYVDGRRAARIRYRAGDDDITLYIHLPLTPGKMETLGAINPSCAVVETIRGYKVVCWGEHGLDYVLVAQASAAEIFERLQLES